MRTIASTSTDVSACGLAGGCTGGARAAAQLIVYATNKRLTYSLALLTDKQMPYQEASRSDAGSVVHTERVMLGTHPARLR